MKKVLVIAISLLLVLAILFFGGVFRDIFSLFEGGRGVSAPETGIFYLYPDRYEKEMNGELIEQMNRHFIKLDYIKNARITYNVFGDHVSIQTPSDHYLIHKDGTVFVGTKQSDYTVEVRRIDQKVYVSFDDIKHLKGFENLGIEVFEQDGYCLYINRYFEYEVAELAAGDQVFDSEGNVDKYLVATNRGEKSGADVRGVVTEEGAQGYCYGKQEGGIDYMFFISKDPSLTGYVDGSSLKNRKKTTALRHPVVASPKDIVLVWEPVYTDTISTEEIGEMPGLGVVSPTWYTLEDKSGALGSIVDSLYITWSRGRGYKIWPLIFNNSDIDLTHDFLSSYEAQVSFINALADDAVKHGFEGLNLDFEHIYLSDRDAYSHFVNMFCFEMRKWGIVTSVDVNVMDGADNWSKCFDHEVLGNVADLLVIMAYDEHHATSEKPGSNASYNWVSFNLKRILELVPHDKVVLGVPFYTRVWETNEGGTASEVLSMKNTEAFLQQYEFEIVWDEPARQSKASCHHDGSLIEVWIEDVTSLQHKAELVNEFQLAGIAAWRRGFESPEAWDAINYRVKPEVPPTTESQGGENGE